MAKKHVPAGRSKASWSIVEARRNLPSLLRSAAREPQAIYKRRTLVAGVVDRGTLAAVAKQRHETSLADAFREARAIALETGYELPEMKRSDRGNPFASKARRGRAR